MNYKNSILNIIKLQNLIILLIVILILYLIYKYVNNIIQNFKSNNEVTIKLYDIDNITAFLLYLKYYPDIIKNDVGENHGNLDLVLDSLKKMEYSTIEYMFLRYKNNPKLNVKIFFEDYNLNVSGYIIWKSHKADCNYFYPTINIKLNKKSKIKFGYEYFDKLYNIVYNKINDNNNIKLYYIRLIKQDKYFNYLTSVMHIKDKKETQEQCNKIWIDSFFSNVKETMWNHIKKIHYEREKIKNYGRIPRASYIFHGEPGTGKSSFVTRMAMSLKRHIISLDLRVIRSKRHMCYILDTIYAPRVEEPISRKKCIFLLDNFDLALRSLDFKDKLKKKYYQEKFSNENYNTKNTNDINEHDFTICDLVEVFQGNYLLDGLILIAITNDFDEVKKICPELFRDGRMTPIEFKKMDILRLNQLCVEYFNRKLDFTFDGTINNPTSAIIELAMLHIDNFDNFNKALKEVIMDKNITRLDYII